MAKFYIISPNCPPNPVLFPTMKPHFYATGHSFTPNMEDADCFLIDLHTRIADYDQKEIDYVVGGEKPLVTFDEWDRGLMSNDQWPNPLTKQQRQIFDSLTYGGKFIHFCRLFDKTNQSPPKLYPYEKPYAYEEPLLTPDELFNREYDVVFIANDSPSRRRIAYALLNDDRLNCFVSVGNPKLPFNEFLDLHKQGKFFVSSGAGGFTDERVQCLFSVAAIIRQRTDQLLLHDFTNLDNCLRIDSPPTKQDLDTMVEICADCDKLFEVYLRGYKFVKQFYSPEYIANDILQKILSYAS